MHPIHTGVLMSKDPLTSRFKRYLTKQDLSERTIEGYLDDL